MTELEILQYKAQQAEEIITHPRWNGLVAAASVFGIDKFDFINKLIKDEIVILVNSEAVPNAKYEKKGYLRAVDGIESDGQFIQTCFTLQGLAWIKKQVQKGA